MTAGWLHGLDFPPCEPIEVTLPRRSCVSHLAGVALTRSDFGASEIATVQSLTLTSRLRTVADLGRRLVEVEAVVLIETSVRRRLIDLTDLIRWIESHRGYRGIGRLKRGLALVEPLFESPMETRLRLLLTSSGLPKQCLQVSLFDDVGTFIARPDLYYPGARLVLEYDGSTHRDRIAADNRRQNKLVEAGYHVLRFTAGDIFNAPAGVVSLVRRQLLDRLAELPAARFG